MRFYAEADGYKLLFSTNDMVQAIFSAWNYGADLWLVPNGTRKSDIGNLFSREYDKASYIFASDDVEASDLSPYNLRVNYEDDEEFCIINTLTEKTFFMDDVKLLEFKWRK